MVLVSVVMLTVKDGSVIKDPVDLCLERLGFETYKTSFGVLLAVSNKHTSAQVSEALKMLADTYKDKYWYSCQYKEFIDDITEDVKALDIYTNQSPTPGEQILDYQERKARKEEVKKMDELIRTWDDLFDHYRQCK